jgi:UDP-3-O-[3-hydroxymyristoyl] glucosamine N-acyltransferase
MKIDSKEISLSQLIATSKVVTDEVKFVNEQPFAYFTRATSELNEAKCLFIGGTKFAKSIDENTKMVITNSETYASLHDLTCGFCITEKPRDLFFQLMDEYERNLATKLPSTIVGRDCHISPLASVAKKGVVIGDGVTIEDFAQIEPNTIIGDNSIICAGAKIGVQAYNLYDYAGRRKRLFHGGKTIIGKNVLISHNTIVEQALYWYLTTSIADNTKIDVNVIIGHNDCIGKNCEITGGANIAGFVTIGDNTVIRLGVSVANGLRIGNNAHVGIGAVVVHNVKDNANMFGNPAKDISKFSR